MDQHSERGRDAFGTDLPIFPFGEVYDTTLPTVPQFADWYLTE